MNNHKMLVLLGVLMMLAATARVGASIVTGLGVDSTSLDAWRSTNVAKNPTFDQNSDNAYGSDGYYVQGNTGVLASLPSYISSVVVGSVGSLPGTSTFGFDDPSQPIGPTVADVNGIWYSQSQLEGVYIDFFTITLAQPADFVLTTILGTHMVNTAEGSNDAFAPQAVRVTGPGAVSDAITGLSVYAGHPDYAFFHISGNGGDVFTVALLTSTNTGNEQVQFGAAEMSGLGFEQMIPEPATVLLLGLGGLLLWRRRNR